MTSWNPVRLRQLRRLTARYKLIVNVIRKTFATVLTIGGFFAAAPAFATLLTINNPSFEGPTVTAPNYYTYGTQGQSSVTGWNIAGAGAAGVQDTAHFVGDIATAPNGAQFGFVNEGSFDITTLSQTLTDTLQPNTKYTLSIYVGGRTAAGSNPGNAYSITLYAGASPLGSITPVTPTALAWTSISMTYTSPSVVAPGNSLQIQIAVPVGTTQLDFDNVTLDATPAPVPEPGAWKIAGALLLVPLAYRAARSLRKPARAA
jgi:hypothetical protein